MGNSILDKVISSKHEEEITQFVPRELIAKILLLLPSRERTVLVRRFGLEGQSQATLEEIGGTMQVTRERVRQIERGAIKHIIEHPQAAGFLTTVEHVIREYLEQAGGALPEADLFERITAGRDHSDETRRILLFFLRYLCKDRFQAIVPSAHVREGWALRLFPLEQSLKKITVLEQLFSEKQAPLTFASLLRAYREREQDNAIAEATVQSLLGLSNRIAQNIFDEWGLVDWTTIRPRRMKDKIYLVLKQHGKPLHFNDITRMINEAHFDQKIAHPPTVHNELIMDTRFVLVGRGIYALQEWGFKPGIVSDVIADVLQREGGLTREAIVQKVLRERFVGKATIHLALMDRERFVKSPEGHYTLIQK